MTLLRYEIPISVTLVSPFATRGLIADRASIDLPLARNDKKGADGKGELILPGTLITGVLRAALQRLGQASSSDVTLDGETRPLAGDLASLFGRESESDEGTTVAARRVSNEPRRGQLLIRDLEIDAASKGKEIKDHRDYPRIRVDEDLGSVAEGFLQFVEMPFAIGEEITFSGTADLKVGTVGPKRAVALLNRAFALVPALGAIKSAGFGRLAGYEVQAATAVQAPPSTASIATGKPLAVDYTIDRPFLVGGRMASANLFKGDFVIPGGAIKGALADALSTAGRMTTAMAHLLARITIGHAFPRLKEGGKPLHPLPLSLATGERDGKLFLFDRLLQDERDVAKVNGRPAVLRFQPDIKNIDLVKKHLGLDWLEPEYDVRTRTKIDAVRGSAAYENEAGQLFSYAAVKAREHAWGGRIVVPEKADSALVQEIAGLLETGIVGLGKTGAKITATIGRDVTLPTANPPYALTLATPALLSDLEMLRRGRSLRDDYALYWEAQGYQLLRFFAQQELVGGYLALRYPPRPDACEPYFVTLPGSVFLVEPMAGAKPLSNLLTCGLPPNPVFSDRDWQSCPFLPENGFGQVLLDAVDHHRLAEGADITPGAGRGTRRAA